MQHDSRQVESAGLIAARLRKALHAIGHPGAALPLVPLADKGLAHVHMRLAGTGLLARIPKQSQLGLPPAQALAYEAACFRSAAASERTPRLHGVLPPSEDLPRGALLVDEVVGRPLALPGELPAMARCLAALHALPVPPADARPPVLEPADALAVLLQEIAQQAVHLDAGRHPEAARAARGGLDALQALAARTARPEVRLIAFDAHPGNFLLDAQGRAWLVDLEKCRYAYPGLDLAHATLYTSTTWDLGSSTTLGKDEVLDFYGAWEAAVDAQLAAAARPWHAPLRLAMWLWSLSWCAKWQALSAREPDAGLQGEDWSADHSDAALVAHVRERVAHYLDARTVAQVQA
ncbi:MAG: aminoglycoside phosphotransferase family protein, partial [Comamonadaceae bacterium]